MQKFYSYPKERIILNVDIMARNVTNQFKRKLMAGAQDRLVNSLLGDEMNPKRVYGSCTLIGFVVVRNYDANFGVHFVPKAKRPGNTRSSKAEETKVRRRFDRGGGGGSTKGGEGGAVSTQARVLTNLRQGSVYSCCLAI